MKQFVLFGSIILFTINGFSQTVISVEGEVSGTLQADTVKVTGNLFVPADTELSIVAGTVVKFMGYYSIDVRGNMKALGNENDTILFTAIDTAGFHMFIIFRFTAIWNFMPTLIMLLCVEKSVVGMGVS